MPSPWKTRLAGTSARTTVNSRTMSDITRILDAIQQGDPKAAHELLPLVYDELRRLAALKMANLMAGRPRPAGLTSSWNWCAA